MGLCGVVWILGWIGAPWSFVTGEICLCEALYVVVLLLVVWSPVVEMDDYIMVMLFAGYNWYGLRICHLGQYPGRADLGNKLVS